MRIFMVQIKRQSKGGEMTQLVKGLLEKHEDVRVQSPRIHIKGWMWHYMPIIPAPGGTDRRISGAHWPIKLNWQDPGSRERDYLKR